VHPLIVQAGTSVYIVALAYVTSFAPSRFDGIASFVGVVGCGWAVMLCHTSCGYAGHHAVCACDDDGTCMCWQWRIVVQHEVIANLANLTALCVVSA
jgi:hypothetical protein